MSYHLNLVHDFINTVTYKNLTAEHAETAEVISAMTRPQDIFLVLVYLAQPTDYLLFSALSANSAVNKNKIESIQLFNI
jgi:hypothetical protein